jgi:hypothetical protein
LRGQRENGVVRCDQGPGQYMLWEISLVRLALEGHKTPNQDCRTIADGSRERLGA